MQIVSSSFQHEDLIPSKFTCDGNNISPELSWRDAPPNTQSFALIMHDPDAPRAGGFTHWVIYDIPADVAALEPNVPKEHNIAGSGIQGKNDSGSIGYMGPCPPSGTHRYFIRLFALDRKTGLQPGATLKELQKAIQGHVIEQAELMGRYARASEKAA